MLVRSSLVAGMLALYAKIAFRLTRRGISGEYSAYLRKSGRWQPLPTDTTTGGRAVFSHWLSGKSAVPGETLNLVIFGVSKTVKSVKFAQHTSYVRTLKNTDGRINVQVRSYENPCFRKYA